MEGRSAYIFEAIRTARGAGRDKGSLAGTKPVALLKALYSEMNKRGIDLARASDVVLGCVTQVGDQGGNIAKTSAVYAGLPLSISGATVNRFCASSLDAVGIATARVACGMDELIIAGGVESMSRVPMMSDKGAHYADPEVARATRFLHMGVVADILATLRHFKREDLDAVAVESHARASRATKEGRFTKSIVPIIVNGAPFGVDETIREGMTLERLAKLEGAFASFSTEALASAGMLGLSHVDHLHTIATSPGIADGASLVAIGSKAIGDQLGIEPRAKVLSVAYDSVDPLLLLTSTVTAAEKALAAAKLTVKDIDLVECNESFAATVLEFTRALKLDPERINVNGGVIAMGHALGATGGNLIATLLDELERTDKRTGLVTIPGALGAGVAVIIERV